MNIVIDYLSGFLEYLLSIQRSESELFQTGDYYGRPFIKKSSLNLNRPLNLKSFFSKCQ